MVVPSENVKSFTTTRDNRTKKMLVVRSTKEKRGSHTIRKRIQSLGLFNETIDLMHLVKSGFGPTFRLDYLLHFLPKRSHVLWEGSQVVERMNKSLQMSLVIADVMQKSNLIIHH